MYSKIQSDTLYGFVVGLLSIAYIFFWIVVAPLGLSTAI